MKRNYAYSLVDLLRDYCDVPSALDTHLSGVSIDSRKVKKGDLFIAVSGDQLQLNSHIAEAIENGANAILREGQKHCKVHEDKDAVEVCMQDLDVYLGRIVSRFYLHPSKDLKVIGVTGTNGKTSVTNYLATYFSQKGQLCGVIGTLGVGFVGSQNDEMIQTGYTTPNVVEVHRSLASLRDSGADIVVMEVSSHGLCQNRVDEVEFYGAVFTNLTREHLDYHGSMKEYASAKQQLFKSDNLKFAVLNRDDDYFCDFKAVTNSSVAITSYARINHTADISVLTQEYSPSGISALVKAPIGQIALSSPLLGEFNLSNLLAVIAVATAMNDLDDLETRLNQIKAVAGRMEVVRSDGCPVVVVDYAHTPDALENVLHCLRNLCDREREGVVRLVFGCGGDRDQGKRAEMAKIAESLADDIIVTDDNPRGESPEDIIRDIMAGFSTDKAAAIVHDRREAISQMLSKSTENDVILLAGKGHEEWQEVSGQRHYFSDVGAVRDLIAGIQRVENEKQEVLHD